MLPVTVRYWFSVHMPRIFAYPGCDLCIGLSRLGCVAIASNAPRYDYLVEIKPHRLSYIASA